MGDSPKIQAPLNRERASLGLEVPVEATPNRVRVVVLQHPQEPDKELGSAALLVRALENAELKVGLSWRSLRAVAGEGAIPSEWLVLYLGAKGKHFPAEVNFANVKGEPAPVPNAVRGLLVLDGTWTQAKALWWRNAWLTKLRRVVLQPRQPSRYGRLRKEPRPEAVSTIEAAAMALGQLEPKGAEIRAHLEGAFQAMLDEYQKRRIAIAPPAKP